MGAKANVLSFMSVVDLYEISDKCKAFIAHMPDKDLVFKQMQLWISITCKSAVSIEEVK